MSDANLGNNSGQMTVKIDRSPEVEKEKQEKEVERKAKEEALRLAEQKQKELEEKEKMLKEKEDNEKKLTEEKTKIEEEKKLLEEKAKKTQEELERKTKEEEEAKTKLEKETAEKKAAELEEKKSQFLDKAKNVIPSERLVMMKESIKSEAELASAVMIFEELENTRKAYEKEIAENKNKKNPNGTVGLTHTEGGNPLKNDDKKGYENYKEMMDDLRMQELAGDPQAKEIIDALWLKELTELKEKHRPLVSTQNFDAESLAEKFNKRARIYAIGNKE